MAASNTLRGKTLRGKTLILAPLGDSLYPAVIPLKPSASGPVAYTLTCDAGSYSLTGVAATLSYLPGSAGVNYTLVCDAGAYAYTGVAASLKQAHSLVCSAGSYSYTGVAATLKQVHSLVCSAGSYSLTGNAATLLQAHSLVCSAGSYSLTGVAATLSVKHSLSCASGSYSLTGNAATLTYTAGAGSVAYLLTCDAGSYSLTGNQATIPVTRNLLGATGVYSVTGVAATLTYAPGTVLNYTLTCAPGSYGYSGNYVDSGYIEEGYIGNITLTQGNIVHVTREQSKRLEAVWRLHGLGDPLVVTPTSRSDGIIVQTLTGSSPVIVTTTSMPSGQSMVTSWIDDLGRWYGLVDPMVEDEASRTDGTLSQSVVTVDTTTTVTRL